MGAFRSLLLAVATASLVFAIGCGDDAAGDNKMEGSDSDAGMGAGGMGAGGAGGMGAGGMGAGGMGAGGMGAGGMGGNPEPGDPAVASTDGNQSSRVTFLDTPADVETADDVGCTTVGANNGSSLAGIVGQIGPEGLNGLVQPDENGDTQLILLAQLKGWEAGQTVDQAHDLTLNLHNGEIDENGGFWLSAASFDDNGNPFITFPDASIARGHLTTPPSTFNLQIPLLGLVLNIALEEAQMFGNVRVDEVGYSSQNGRIEGYLTEGSIIAIVTGLQAYCASDDPNEQACGLIAAIAPPGTPPEEAVPALLALLGGSYDSKINNGARECDTMAADDCNALSVCFLYETTGIDVLGVGEPE